MNPKDLPIGYWIKKADEALTNGINKIQSAFGITRTDWQILNSLKNGNGISKDEIISAMHPFAERAVIEKVLTQFKDKLLLDEQDSKLRLTQKGFEVHRQCFERQMIFRKRSMKGISELEYKTSYLTLKRLVDNIETE